MTNKIIRCLASTQSGQLCKVKPLPGSKYCRWHSEKPEAKAKRQADSAKGGLSKAYGALTSVPSISEVLDVDALDLETAAGSRALLAGALRQLARLPLDVRVANAIGQVCTAQRGVIEASDFEARLASLEAQSPGLRRA